MNELKRCLSLVFLVACSTAHNIEGPPDSGPDSTVVPVDGAMPDGSRPDATTIDATTSDSAVDGSTDLPIPCGQRGLAECPSGQFCLMAQCGATDAPGICQQRPVACTDEFAPVCGCDRRTYSNACEASAAGQSVYREGECQPDGGYQCGGFAGQRCPNESYYCSYDQCNVADAQGICRLRPTQCSDEPGAAVCGCDRQVYRSLCHAEMAGVSVAPPGQQSCMAAP